MTVKRIYSGNINSENAYIIESTEKVISLTKEDISKVSLIQEVERLDEVFFLHKNRNGTIAVATGQEPIAWPEDEIKEIK